MQDIHDQVWEDIPWFLTGKLSPSEMARVERHAASCKTCQREIAEQRRVSTALVESDPVAQTSHANWTRLQDRLEPHAPSESDGSLRKLRAFLARLHPLQVGGGLAACAMVFFAFLVLPVPTTYQTLTAPPSASVEHDIRIRAVPGIDHAGLVSDLEAAGMTIVRQSGADAIIYASLPTDPDTRARVRETLRSDPRIALIAGASQ